MKTRVGDTLIEVTLAIGIFSMVAISIVAVMNSSSSSAQTALESTLAREEIDAQAEALRYIHSAYIDGLNAKNSNVNSTTDNEYVELWHDIVKNAVSQSDADNQPTSCNDIYSNDTLKQKAFVIDTRSLNNPSSALIFGSSNKLVATTTYPRLLFGSDTLTTDTSSHALSSAEGVYVFAVKDEGDTSIITNVNNNAANITGTNKSAYYDFYIHTCWYGTGDDTPSSIATVVRLYDPEPFASSAVKTVNRTTIRYNVAGGTTSDSTSQRINEGEPATKLVFPSSVTRPGYAFLGWYLGTTKIADYKNGKIVYENYNSANLKCVKNVGCTYTPPSPMAKSTTVIINATWKRMTWTITYNTNGSSYTIPANTTTCYQESTDPCPITTQVVTRSGYEFLGWSTSKTATVAEYPVGTTSIPNPGRNITLYAVWKFKNVTITIELSWTSSIDYDSYIHGTKASGDYFLAYYGQRAPTETVNGVTRVLAELDQDCRGSCRTETFTINTLGGRNFYYFVKNFGTSSTITGATVKVYIDGTLTKTFKSSDAKGSGRVWNVFAYKDGKFVTRQRFSESSSSSGSSGAELNY